MSIFQNMRVWKLLALCVGIVCIIGCGRTNIRETVNKEVNIKETSTREVKIEKTKKREIVTNRGGISSVNLIEVPLKEGTGKKNSNNKQSVLYDETGIASFISDDYDGKMTASGVRYDINKMTAAHPSLPFDTKILITNLRNKRKAEVIIIDRFSPTKNRILNVSRSAAVELDLVESGVAKVGIKIIANLNYDSN